jgi:hypothetical protein
VAVSTVSAALLALFRRFAAKGHELSSPQNQPSIATVWKETLGGDAAMIFRVLDLIQQSIARTAQQIGNEQNVRR